jgi:FdhD protein
MLDRVPILRIYKEARREKERTEDTVVVEHSLTITLNSQELVTLLCSPEKLDYLAVGFLFSEGLIKTKEDIGKISIDKTHGMVRVVTTEEVKILQTTTSSRLIASSGGRGIFPYGINQWENKIDSQLRISPVEIFNLLEGFVHRSEVFESTGGVHSAALSDTKGILFFSEDIGRHNAIDKVFGECLLKGIPTDDHIVLTSGRVSSEIVHKVVKRNIPILISKSAPTTKGIKLADELALTLIGFAREGRMNVYTHRWRVESHER